MSADAIKEYLFVRFWFGVNSLIRQNERRSCKAGISRFFMGFRTESVESVENKNI
jgi:hypothetical protein